MPKTAVQNPVCDIRGADVRAGSQFCYNCGGSLKQDGLDRVEVPAKEATVPATGNGAGKPKPGAPKAARRPRKVERGPVEVVWEPREGVSLPFVITSMLLLLIATALFVIAMWLK